MDSNAVDLLLDNFSHLPRFSDGRIDFSSSDLAPAIVCYVFFKDKILLVKRSDKVLHYKGLWNCVGGYLDEPKDIVNKACEELREETGIGVDKINNISVFESFENFDYDLNKRWIIHPVLIEVNDDSVLLDWEHDDFRWVCPADIKNFETIFGFEKSIKKILAHRNVFEG